MTQNDWEAEDLSPCGRFYAAQDALVCGGIFRKLVMQSRRALEEDLCYATSRNCVAMMFIEQHAAADNIRQHADVLGMAREACKFSWFNTKDFQRFVSWSVLGDDHNKNPLLSSLSRRAVSAHCVVLQRIAALCRA